MGILTREKRHDLETVEEEKLSICDSPTVMFVGESTVFKRVTEQLIPPLGFQEAYTPPPAKWLTTQETVV